MTVHIPGVIGMIGGAISYTSMSALHREGYAGEPTLLVPIIVGVSIAVLWWYSPLPNHNGGMGMGEPSTGTWGFTDRTEDNK